MRSSPTWTRRSFSEWPGTSRPQRSEAPTRAHDGLDQARFSSGGERLRPKGVDHTHTLGGDPRGVERLHGALEALVAKGAGRIAMGFGGNPKDPSAVRGGPVFELMFVSKKRLVPRLPGM